MKKEELTHHLVVGTLVNLVAVLAAGTYLLENPVLRLVATLTVVLALVTFALVIRWVRRSGKNLRHLGYHFLPTTLIFWALNERGRRVNAQAEKAQLKEMIATWPDTWQVADSVLELGIGICALLGGVYGTKAVRFLGQAKAKSKTLQEIIAGNELFKKGMRLRPSHSNRPIKASDPQPGRSWQK